MSFLLNPTGFTPHTYSTLNPSDCAGTITLSGGNLVATKNTDAAHWVSVRGTDSKSGGQWYFELTTTNNTPAQGSPAIGIANSSFIISGSGQQYVGDDSNSYGYHADGSVYTGGGSSASYDYWGNAGNTAAVAVDFTAALIWFRKDGSGNWNGSPTNNPTTGVGGLSLSGLAPGPYFPTVSVFSNTVPDIGTINFGATSFVGTVPSGFAAWG